MGERDGREGESWGSGVGSQGRIYKLILIGGPEKNLGGRTDSVG